jgi:hypothetical protein
MGPNLPVPARGRERLESAQPRHCRGIRRRSLHHPICRLSPSCGASRWFAELTIYALASRLSASWMEAIQRRTSDKIALRFVGPRRRLACSTLRFCSLPLQRHRAGRETARRRTAYFRCGAMSRHREPVRDYIGRLEGDPGRDAPQHRKRTGVLPIVALETEAGPTPTVM